MTISVDWRASLEFSDYAKLVEIAGAPVELSHSRPDAPAAFAVIDENSFDSASAFTDALHDRVRLPAVIILNDRADELELIRVGLAGPLDEFCSADRAAMELSVRIARLLSRLPDFAGGGLERTLLVGRRRFLEIAGNATDTTGIDQPQSIILVDLDDMLDLRAEQGPEAIEGAIASVAAILSDLAPWVACAAQLSVDQYAVLVGEGSHQAYGLAEYILRTLQEIVVGEEKRLSATVGVVTTERPVDPDTLLEYAANAVSHGKVNGKNRVVRQDELLSDVTKTNLDNELLGFEDRIRDLAERFGQELAVRGRRIISRLRDGTEQDGLTGLYNRRYFNERFPREIDRVVGTDRSLSLAMLDLDHFGEINRVYGFPGGDRALIAAAITFRSASRTVDWVARYGGEEFCVVMPDTNTPDALAVAERIRSQIAALRTSVVGGRIMRFTASLGVITLDGSQFDRAPDVEEILQQVSDAVRAAKNAGRNQVSFGNLND